MRRPYLCEGSSKFFMSSNMSDSEEALEGSTSKTARTSSSTPTVAPRLWKTSNNFVSQTAKGLFDHLEKVKKNCKASNGWWHLLKVVYAGDDEPVKIQCTECDVMMSSINRLCVTPIVWLLQHHHMAFGMFCMHTSPSQIA